MDHDTSAPLAGKTFCCALRPIIPHSRACVTLIRRFISDMEEDRDEDPQGARCPTRSSQAKG